MSRRNPSQLGPFIEGMPISENLKADDLEAIKEMLAELLDKDEGLQVYTDEVFYATIDNSGKTPYTDERYWLKRCFCDTAAGDEDAAISFAAETEDPYAYQITATNLAELKNSTHLLESAADTEIVVLVQVIVDDQEPAIRHYIFFHHEGYYDTTDAEVIHDSTTSASSDHWLRDDHDETYKGKKEKHSNDYTDWVDGDTIRHYFFNYYMYVDTGGHERESDVETLEWYEVDVIGGSSYSAP